MKLFVPWIVLASAAYAGTNTWTPLGPFGGTVTTLAVDPSNPGTVYAATGATAGDGGRLYKTTDGGANWTLLNSALSATSIAIDPQNSATVYVGLRGDIGAGALVFKSTDGGANFRLANSGLEAVQFYGALAVDPTKSGTVYATMIQYQSDPCRTSRNCFGMQVFKTMDGGASWSATGAGLPPADSLITALAVDPQDPRILYAGLDGTNGATGGIFQSTNAGASWSAINSSVTMCCTYTSQGLVVDPQNHDTLYAVSFGEIVRLSSAGTILGTTPLGAGNITCLGIDPSKSGALYAATSSGIFKSTDGGITWAATAVASQDNASYYVLAVDQSSGTVYAGSRSGYGVFKSTDGGANWTPATYGLGAFRVKSVTVDPNNSGTLYAQSDTPQGVFKTMDGGRNWAAVPGLASNSLTYLFSAAAPVAIDPRNSNTLYAVTRDAVLKSTDRGASWNEAGGASWTAARTALGPNGRYAFWGALAIDPQNPDTLYVLANAQVFFTPGCCRTDVFKTTDGGNNWSMTASLGGNDVTLLSIDPRNSSTLYAAGWYRPTIGKSTDGGVTWIESFVPAGPTDDDDSWSNIRSVAIDPRDSNIVYAAGSGGIFKSTDGGENWTNFSSGLTPYACSGSGCYPGEPYLVVSLAIDPHNSTLYAAAQAGILRSTDGGSSWSQMNAGLPAPPGANSLALDPGNPATFYAAGAGIYAVTFVPEI